MAKINKKDGNTHNIFITKWWQSEGIVEAMGRYDPTEPGRPYWIIDDPWARYAKLFTARECFETLEQAQTNVYNRAERKAASLRKQLASLCGFKPEIKDCRGKNTIKEGVLREVEL